jgi:uroporphyrinogen III methyltransferase / synthase
VRSGKVYLIGAGPGDPALITLRAVEVLGRCDVVLYDALAHPSLLEHMRPDAKAIFVGKRGHEYSEPQESINRMLLEHARAGEIVGRLKGGLKGGDPLLFGRGGEELVALAEAGIPYEVVPGISSPVAASAYAGIPLTHRDVASSVLFLTGTAREGMGPDGHDWKRLATRAGTICLLMAMKRLREIAQSLIDHGRPASTPTAVIQWGSRPDQRTVTAPLDRIADAVEEARLGTPALVIVGQVVEMRERLRWFDNQPLFGKRVLVTRPRRQAPELCRKLRERGAEPLLHPTIEIRPADDPSLLREAVDAASTYDWVVFTSDNGVEHFFSVLEASGRDARAFGKALIAAIGPSTAQALAKKGVRADLVPPAYKGEELAEAVLASCRERKIVSPRVLLPRAKVARDVFPEAIRAAGGNIDVVTAYETHAPSDEAAQAIRTVLVEGNIHVITLTSSSTAENLSCILGAELPRLLAGKVVASIGPVTTATARRLGIDVAVTADEFTVPGLIDALERYFR